MRSPNGDESEGLTEGTVSDDRPYQRRKITFGSEDGEGEAGTDSGRDELSSSRGFAAGGFDSGSSCAETPSGKRRGRPPGTKNKSSDKLAGIRNRFAGRLAGAVRFGVSCWGAVRANGYKKHSPLLAKQVYLCYQLNEETAKDIGDPLADTFIEWFPEWVGPVSKGIDPAVAIGRILAALQQVQENEKLVVMHWQQSMAHQPPPNNGAEQGDPNIKNGVNEWMNQNSPSPEEIAHQG